jgi:hypothetical protein
MVVRSSDVQLLHLQHVTCHCQQSMSCRSSTGRRKSSNSSSSTSGDVYLVCPASTAVQLGMATRSHAGTAAQELTLEQRQGATCHHHQQHALPDWLPCVAWLLPVWTQR